MDYVASDIGETEIASTVGIGEARMFEAHEMEDSGMKVVDMDFLFDGLITEVVGGSISCAAFDAASHKDSGEAFVVVVATVLDVDTASDFCPRPAAKFAADDDESFFEEAACFEVRNEGGDGLVCLLREFAMDENVVVAVPGFVVAEVDLDSSNASFDETAGDEAATGEVAIASGGLDFHFGGIPLADDSVAFSDG